MFVPVLLLFISVFLCFLLPPSRSFESPGSRLLVHFNTSLLCHTLHIAQLFLHLSTLLSSCLSTSLLLNTCFVLTRTHAQVEFPEFVELINRLDRGTTHSEEAVLAAFRHFDPDGSGFVEEPEVRLT